jgi:heme a synthase
MDPVAARAGGGDLRRLRLLVNATIVATLLLILVGGFVRVSESGLGCGPAGSGTDGWPLCDGRVVPLINEKSLIEFSHRIFATLVLVLTALAAWRARKLGPEGSFLRGATVGALFLVFAQAALGGLTVENNLHELLVAGHLALAMIFLGLLLVIRWAAAAQEAPTQPPAPPSPRGLRPMAAVASVLVLATIVAGGYMAGTEEEGVKDGVANGAHLACGEEFPGCLGGVLPFGEYGRLVDIHLTHRALVYTTTAAILLLMGMALRRRLWSREFSLIAGLLALQLLLGALNVWLGKHPGLIVAHLLTGTLLWVAALSVVLRLSPAPAPSAEPASARAEGSPVTA